MGPGHSQLSLQKRLHSTVSNQPESPPKDGKIKPVARKAVMMLFIWWFFPKWTKLKGKTIIRTQEPTQNDGLTQRSLGVNLGTLWLPWSAWAASSDSEAMPQRDPRQGSGFCSPYYLIQQEGAKPHLSSWSCLWTDLAQFCPHRMDIANLAFICKALLRACSNLGIPGSQG